MLEGIAGTQGLTGIDNLKTLQMLQTIKGSGIEGGQRTKEEFLAIFYKELLKQAFKPPHFGLEDEGGENSSITGVFGSDLLVDKLALELARSGAFSPKEVF